MIFPKARIRRINKIHRFLFERARVVVDEIFSGKEFLDLLEEKLKEVRSPFVGRNVMTPEGIVTEIVPIDSEGKYHWKEIYASIKIANPEVKTDGN